MEKRFSELLARVHQHLPPESTSFEGKEFHRVGRNSSHDFYLALDQGSLWVMSFGMDYDENDAPVEDRYVRRLSAWEELGGCYLGHF